MKIAILGSTSHIAKNLIDRFKQKDLYLFSRSRKNLDSFIDGNYDVVINCIGVGTPNKLKDLGTEIFRFTEYYDNLPIMVEDYFSSFNKDLRERILGLLKTFTRIAIRESDPLSKYLVKKDK